MDDHLSKPFTLNELSRVLAQYLPQRPTEDETQSRREPDVTKIASTGTSATSGGNKSASLIDRTILDSIRTIEGRGSAGLLKTVITHYVNRSPEVLSSLRKAVDADDAAVVEELAHGLKSTSANLGALGCAKLCAELEAVGRAGTVHGCHALLIRLEQEFHAAAEALMAEL
jgi:HPt (histidine-containing phosphotransfer) domain-containing protein